MQRYGDFLWVPNVFVVFWLSDSDRGAKGRQVREGGLESVASIKNYLINLSRICEFEK